MKYFSYGMNTNRAQMAMRCPDARSVGQAVLYGHEFRFARHADIIENPEYNTEGVLWDITADCEKSLDALEGFPSYYLKKQVNVFYNGTPVECMVYYMTDPDNTPDELPSDGYLEMLFEGYTEHDVNTEQIIDSIDLITSIKQRQLDLQAKYFPEEA
jgi:gamma-glutamylcyclotransferase (GGCT)/AIG2-like uncharacterized protein YtfP